MGKSAEKQKLVDLEAAIFPIPEAEPIVVGSEIVEALNEGKGNIEKGK